MKYYFENILKKTRLKWYRTENTHIEKPKYKKTNDIELIKLRKKMITLIKLFDVDNPYEKKVKDGFFECVKNLMKNCFNIDSRKCEFLVNNKTYSVTIEFIKRAQKFKPNMPFDSMQQALRNIWVMTVLQIYFNTEIELTDAMFAYSMLYPLTDNYLDDKYISKETKNEFSKRFFKKIKNNEDLAENKREKEMFYMIDLISNQYSRDKYPELYESLLSILDAQNKSIHQQKLTSIFDIDMLEYTFYKGGTSVLADAYLVKGNLNQEEIQFAFTYGIILQLADDLQDTGEDLNNEHYTMMNLQAQHKNLDEIYFKYKNFIKSFLEEQHKIDNEKRKALKTIVKVSIDLIILGGFYKNKRFFSPEIRHLLIKNNYFSKKEYNKTSLVISKKIKQKIKKSFYKTSRP